MKKKSLKLEFFRLPQDSSHIQDMLYRVSTDSQQEWVRVSLPYAYFHKQGIKRYMEEFASNLIKFMSDYKEYKIQVFECKIVRKNGRKNKKKTQKKSGTRT